MRDFIIEALPFVICGIAIICLVMNKDKKESYIAEGMCFGSMLGAMYPSYLGLSLSLGMLIGEAIGSFFSKK